MTIARIKNAIAQPHERNAYLRPFLREPRGHDGFLTALILLRFVTLLGVIVRFGINRDAYTGSPGLFTLVRAAVLGAFIYILILGAVRLVSRPDFVSRRSKIIQIVVDIVSCSALYILTKDPESDLFILYSFPLLIAVEYFGLIASLGVLAATLLTFVGVLWSIDSLFETYLDGAYWKVFFPRAVFFLIFTLPYMFHRRLQTPFETDVAAERESLFLHLERIPDSPERKLLVQGLVDYTRKVERSAELLAWELKRKNELMNPQLSAIFEASQAIVSSDEKQTLSRSIELLGEALGCQAGMLRLRGTNAAGGVSLVLRGSYGYAERYHCQLQFLDLDRQSVAVEVFRTKQTRLYRDVQSKLNGEGERRIHFAEFLKACDLHSMICVPLIVQGEALGTLSFYRQAIRSFAPDEINLCQGLASYLALMVTNFSLYRETLVQANEREAWLNTLHTLGTQLTGFDNLDTLLQFVVDVTRERLQAEVSAIFLIEHGLLQRKALSGLDNSWYPEERYRRGEGLTGRAITMLDQEQLDRTILENQVEQNDSALLPNVEKYRGILASRTVKHLIAVPLVGKNGPFGVLRVINRLDQNGQLSTRGFTKGAADLLYTIGCEVGIAIENARLLAELQWRYEEAARRAREAETILKVGQIVSFTLDLEHILQTIVQEMAMVFEVEQAGIVLFDQEHEYGYLAAQYQNSPDDTAAKVHIPLRGNPSIDQVLVTKAPLAIYDAENDPLTSVIRDVIRLRNIKSILIVPLIVNGELIGTLGLDSIKVRRHFRPEELRLCQLVAAQAAMAIENARLFEEAVEQKNRLRDYCSMVGEKLVEHTDVGGLHTFIVHTAARLLDAEDCSLYLVNDVAQIIDFVASSYLPQALFRQNPTSVSAGLRAGLTAYVAATGEILRFVGDDFKSHPAWSGDFRDHLRHFASGACDSLLIVPMRNLEAKIIGVLKVENKLGREMLRGFSPFDAELLTILADQVARHIERAQEYARLSQKLARRERDRLEGDLHDTLNVFHSGVMLGAETARSWLNSGHYDLVDAELDQVWRVSRFTYGELHNIMQDLRDPILQKQGLIAALRNYANMVGRDLIVLRTNMAQRLDFDREYALYRIAQGAISNAVRHAGLNSVVDGKVWIDVQLAACCVTLSVRDNGRGFILDDIEDGKAMSYGVRRMQKLAKNLGAELQIESAPKQGTTVKVVVVL